MLGWLNIIAFAGTVAVNGLANVLPIAGVKTEDVSAKYQHLFSPADYAFAIWGAIYLLLAGFVWYQKKHEDIAKKCGAWFIVNCIANALWMVLWHYEILGLSVLCMGVILLSLIVLNLRLADKRDTWQEKLFVQAGLGLYLGWICVATAANAASFLVQVRFSGFGIAPEVWTIAVAVLLALLSMATLERLRNVFFGLAVAWGIIGVMAQHFTAYQMRYGWVLAGCVLALAIVLIAVRRVLGEEKTEKAWND